VVRTRDEVADVATALNTVQDTALDLAVEQAVLRRNIADSFVNLGRRNQNLLGRQLDFITELEASETNPDTLANLFRLDHLATRMRRNAESLLVLAGIEPPRQWAAPVRLTDVIRAALGEVEDYQRVTVRGVDPATIVGSAAADLAHLLAELIENALVFSPPDQTVDIRGRNRPDGYTLAIIDSGLGMPSNDVVAANRRLAGAESFTIAPSKYLGHYVAGNLAARHDIRVSLDNSPGNGITATIDLPPALLTADEVAPPADEPHAARDVWPPAPTTRITGELPAVGGSVPPSGTSWPAEPTRGTGRPTTGAGIGPAAALPPPFDPGPLGAGRGGPGGPGPFAPGPGTPTGPAPAQPSWLTGTPGAPAGPAPAVPGLSGFGPQPPSAEEEARRTASGLVKRTPRVVDTGEVRALGASPDDTLLASLSRVTGGRPRNPEPDQRPPAQQPPAQPPAGQAFASPWPPDSAAPGAPPPSLPRRGAPSRPARPDRTSARDASLPRRSKGAPLGGLASGLSGLSTFDPRSATSGDRGTGGTRGDDGPASSFGGAVPAPPPGGAPGAEGSGGMTSGGLARRVRGAQLPNANPLALRRSGGAPPPGAGGPVAGGPAAGAPGSAPSFASMPPPVPPTPQAPPASPAPAGPQRTSEQTQSADAVYGFLTSFTAGVQRGLDESRGT
jgi:hypothetical protein